MDTQRTIYEGQIYCNKSLLSDKHKTINHLGIFALSIKRKIKIFL